MKTYPEKESAGAGGHPAATRSGKLNEAAMRVDKMRLIGKRILAACEPLMAALYWPCLRAKSSLEDQRANEAADSWYLNSALRSGGENER